jgi:hypothetical protein
MSFRARRILLGLGIAVVAYLAAYLWYRSTHAEVWARDGQRYVIFGSRATYYFYRPVAYADGALTGMSFHIGPHQ